MMGQTKNQCPIPTAKHHWPVQEAAATSEKRHCTARVGEGHRGETFCPPGSLLCSKKARGESLSCALQAHGSQCVRAHSQRRG